MTKPFVWTADPDTIIDAIRCGHHVLDSILLSGVSHAIGHA